MSTKTMSKKNAIARRRPPLPRAAVQWRMIYNAVKVTPTIVSEDARGSLMAQLLDLAETLDILKYATTPFRSLDVGERAFGPRAKAWPPSGRGAR